MFFTSSLAIPATRAPGHKCPGNDGNMPPAMSAQKAYDTLLLLFHSGRQPWVFSATLF